MALYILNQKRANLRDLERRFGVAVTIEADDSLTGSNYHAIERGELATGVKGEVEVQLSPSDDIVPAVEEPAPLEEEAFEEAEARGDDEVLSEEEIAGDRARSAASDEGDGGRRRRRRRRRRGGGERPFGEGVAPDAPQPTDDGLAVVAQIGGDMIAPIDDAESFDRRGPREEGDRGRRPKRHRVGRHSFSPRENDERHGTAGGSGEVETDLLGSGPQKSASDPDRGLESTSAAQEELVTPAKVEGQVLAGEERVSEEPPVRRPSALEPDPAEPEPELVGSGGVGHGLDASKVPSPGGAAASSPKRLVAARPSEHRRGLTGRRCRPLRPTPRRSERPNSYPRRPFTPEAVPQRQTKRFRLDLEHVAFLSPQTVAVRERRGSKEMDMDVARPAE